MFSPIQKRATNRWWRESVKFQKRMRKKYTYDPTVKALGHPVQYRKNVTSIDKFNTQKTISFGRQVFAASLFFSIWKYVSSFNTLGGIIDYPHVTIFGGKPNMKANRANGHRSQTASFVRRLLATPSGVKICRFQRVITSSSP